eukprot:6976668-Pyramimonas_sp.AAC.1
MVERRVDGRVEGGVEGRRGRGGSRRRACGFEKAGGIENRIGCGAEEAEGTIFLLALVLRVGAEHALGRASNRPLRGRTSVHRLLPRRVGD